MAHTTTRNNTQPEPLESQAETDVETLKAFIDSGADLNAQNSKGQTPLHLACLLNNIEAIELLLAAGADPNTQDAQGQTPLLAAVKAGHTQAVNSLANSGADPAIRRYEDPISPLDVAARDDRPDMIRVLVNAGADVNAADKDDALQPIHYAACYGSPLALEALIECGANVEAQTRTGVRALHLAPDCEHCSRFIQILAKHGANLDARVTGHGFDYAGCTALMIAGAEGNLEAMRALIDAGADVNAQSRDHPGELELHLAIGRGNREAFELLIGAGSDIDSTEMEQGETPLSLAIATRAYDMARELINHGAEPTYEVPYATQNDALRRPIAHRFAEDGDIEALQFLQDIGIDIYGPDQDGHTPCDCARLARQSEVVEFYEALERVSHMGEALDVSPAAANPSL